MFKYKNNKGEWVEYKETADSVTTKTGSTVQKELDKLQKNQDKNTEDIKQLSEVGGNAGYVTSPSGVKFKLCVTDTGEISTALAKIPRVDIIGSLEGIGKDKPVWVEIKYSGEGEKSFHKKAQLEWQGNTSIHFPKKNFGIDLYELDGETECKMAFRNWNATDSFHLKANWIDATHARNVLCARWANKIYRTPFHGGARGVIDGFPVEVYINKEFHGIYTWNLKQNKDLFQMSKKNENHLVYRADFHDKSGSFADWSNEDIHRVWQNKVPKKITEHTKLARMIKWVGEASNEDFKANISQYLDLKSCIDYYIMMEIMYLPDNRCKNMTLATWDGDIWFPIFYDLDTSWGLHWDGGSTYSPTSEIEKGSRLWDKLVNNFGDQIKARYVELRQSIFTKTNIINEFEIFANIIGIENYKKDQAKWTGIPSKEYGIDFIKDWINKRFAFLDAKHEITLDD